MQETPLRSLTSSGPTARGFCAFLEDLFPMSTPTARFAFAVKSFLTYNPPPFDAASPIDYSREIGIMLAGSTGFEIATDRLTQSKKHFANQQNQRLAFENAIYWITELRTEQIRAALDETELMEKDIDANPQRVGQHAFKATVRALSDGMFGKYAVEKPTKSVGVTASHPTITFGASGQSTIHPPKTITDAPAPDAKVAVNQLANQPTEVKVSLNAADVSRAGGKSDLAVSINACATAIHNILLMQGRPRISLSEIHDRMKVLGHSKDVVLAAIDRLTHSGKAFMDGHALVPSTMMPTTLNGWGPEIIELNRSKGWYDEEQLSDTAVHALAKLTADERTELLKYMPLVPHREPKGRIDVATFCTNLTGEISELWEAYRKGELDKPCDKAAKMKSLGLPELTCAEEEIADILIRTLDTAEFWNLDVQRIVLAKHLFNASREHRHGGKLA